jgi:flagellar motor switch protein FliM
MMNFCIPYLTIEPIIGKLSAQFWYSSVRRGTTPENLNILKEKLSNVDVTIVAEIGKIPVTVGEVLSLEAGDVVCLYNTRIEDPYSLNVGNKRKFLCRPGIIGKKMAVQITKKIADIAKSDLEEIVAAEGEEHT